VTQIQKQIWIDPDESLPLNHRLIFIYAERRFFVGIRVGNFYHEIGCSTCSCYAVYKKIDKWMEIPEFEDDYDCEG